MKNARSITAQFGGSRHGQYGTTPCPVCQPERRRDQIALSISKSNHKILMHCFKRRCSFAEIATAISLPLEHAQVDIAARREPRHADHDSAAISLLLVGKRYCDSLI